MKMVRKATQNVGIAGQLLSYFWGGKRPWLVPLIFVLFLLTALILLAQSSAIAPFIYTLF